MPPSPRLEDVLERYWGFTAFRSLQQAAMDAILAGRDSLVVLPTGGGKSPLLPGAGASCAAAWRWSSRR